MNFNGINMKKIISILSLIVTIIFLSILLPNTLAKATGEKTNLLSLNAENNIAYTNDVNKGMFPKDYIEGNISKINNINKSVYGANQPLEYDEGYLTKKAYTTDEDNVFDVSLKIQGKTQKKSTDIVFLLDNSNSMLENDRVGIIKRQIKRVMDKLKYNNSNTRYALITYASTILDGRRYHYPGSNYNNNMYNITTNNYCYKSFTSNIEEIYNRVPYNVPSQRGHNWVGGTFTQEGLIEAVELFKQSKADQKVIIHLTDGLPTFSYKIHKFGGGEDATYYNSVSGNGTSYFLKHGYYAFDRLENSWKKINNNGFPTVLEAENIKKNNPDINIYTVGLELRAWDNVTVPEIEAFLKYISSSSKNAFLENNINNVHYILNSIINKIEISINDGTVIDPMGKMVNIYKNGNFSRDDYKLTASDENLLNGVNVSYNEKNKQLAITGLNLGENQWVKLDYKVKLNTDDSNFHDDFFYQANGRTVLYPNSKKTSIFRDFVIPSVSGKRLVEVNLNKISSETSKPLVDAEFELYNSKNEKLGSFTTNKDGKVSLGSLPKGDYKLKEIKAPKGYILSTDFINFKINNGKIIQYGKDVENITVSNKPNNIKIKKTDDAKLQSDAKFLKGAKFELSKENDPNFKPLIKESDNNGEIEFKEISPGTYYLKEILAPNGYEKINDKIGPIKVDDKGVVSIPWDKLSKDYVEKWTSKEDFIRIKNKKITSNLYIDKVDAKDSNLHLEGAKFGLYTNDETYKNNKMIVKNGVNYYLISEKVSNKEGKIEWDNLNAEEKYKYLIQETEAPTGYTVSGKDILFHFKDKNIIIENEKELKLLTSIKEKTITIKNAKIYKLPSSGGSGIYPFLIIGTLFITLSLIYAFSDKFLKKNKRDN